MEGGLLSCQVDQFLANKYDADFLERGFFNLFFCLLVSPFSLNFGTSISLLTMTEGKKTGRGNQG